MAFLVPRYATVAASLSLSADLAARVAAGLGKRGAGFAGADFCRTGEPKRKCYRNCYRFHGFFSPVQVEHLITSLPSRLRRCLGGIDRSPPYLGMSRVSRVQPLVNRSIWRRRGQPLDPSDDAQEGAMPFEIALGEQLVRPLRSPKTRILAMPPHQHIGCHPDVAIGNHPVRIAASRDG